MIESKGHKITPIDGDLAVSRNAKFGGDVDVHGKARVAGSLKVEGFLDAPNIKGVVKGLFATEEELKREYPNPRPGWCAIVLADDERGFLYLAKNREWEKQSEEAQPFDFIVDSINVFASKSELVDVKEKTESNKDAINELNTAISDEIVRAVEREDGIARKALKADTAFASPNTKVVNVWGKSVDGSSDMSITIPAATNEKAGVMSAEDKRNLNNSTVKVITWNNDTNQSNMNDLVVAGVYDIKGERTRTDDNLPILNTGGGHSFNARLTVLDSSISGSGKDDDKCITQVLSFSNRLGQGEVYIRTGKGSSLDNLTWEKWSTLQRNVNVGDVYSPTALDDLIDNGVYSGVWREGSFANISYPLTFVCIVINDYFLGGQNPRKVSQFVYGVSALDGTTQFKYRVKIGNDNWGDWEILNKDEISSMIKNSVDNAIKGVIADAPETFDTLREIADWIANDETGAVALANNIRTNTAAITAERTRAIGQEGLLNNAIAGEKTRAELAEQDIKDKAVEADSLNFQTLANVVALDYKTIEGVGDEITIPAATDKNAGVMSATDKVKLNNSYKDIDVSPNEIDVELDIEDNAENTHHVVIPSATTTTAGVMSAADKVALNKATTDIKANADAIVAEKERSELHLADEINKIKDGDTIVGQAREIHSRNGKTVTDSFLARTTAGSGTIGDGVASLKSVGGNIVKNLFDISTATYSIGGGTFEYNNIGIITCTSSPTNLVFKNITYI